MHGFSTTETRQSLFKKSGIYKFTLRGTNRHYVGQARCLWLRLNTHAKIAKSPTKTNKQYIHNAIRKYDPSAFDYSVLCFCDAGALNDLELHFMKEFRCIEDGFNVGTDPHAPRLGVKWTPELRQKIMKAREGKCNTPEMRKANGDRLRGQKRPADVIARAAAKRRKPVQQFTQDWVFIREFPSMNAAGEAVKTCSGNIASAISGKNGITHCRGFKWKYAPALAN